MKVLIQTYYGDVRDVYETLTTLKFDGIGLDFIEGKQTLSLINLVQAAGIIRSES